MERQKKWMHKAREREKGKLNSKRKEKNINKSLKKGQKIIKENRQK